MLSPLLSMLGQSCKANEACSWSAAQQVDGCAGNRACCITGNVESPTLTQVTNPQPDLHLQSPLIQNPCASPAAEAHRASVVASGTTSTSGSADSSDWPQKFHCQGHDVPPLAKGPRAAVTNTRLASIRLSIAVCALNTATHRSSTCSAQRGRKARRVSLHFLPGD